jgi:hypothetical protein
MDPPHVRSVLTARRASAHKMFLVGIGSWLRSSSRPPGRKMRPLSEMSTALPIGATLSSSGTVSVPSLKAKELWPRRRSSKSSSRRAIRPPDRNSGW